MTRTDVVEEMRARAQLYWPQPLRMRQANLSVLPSLLETQEKFIGLLYVADSSPTAWKEILPHTDGLPGNLFLKHLMVLSDIGGEPLKQLRRIVRESYAGFPMHFRWKEGDHEYRFTSLESTNSWGNNDLGVTGKQLLEERPIDESMQDVAMLILFGGGSLDGLLPEGAIAKCKIGPLMGQKQELDHFVRQRYIEVSAQLRGATAESLGRLAQQYVRERLRQELPDWDFGGKRIPGTSQSGGRTLMSFDIVAKSPKRRFCAVEVTFQETTNSVIERKAGQAADRQQILHRLGHRISYVVDGVGNFMRASAVRTICEFSDCTVTLTDAELHTLAEYLSSLDS